MALENPNIISKPRTIDLYDYIMLARPEHWVKHVFIVPGAVLAVLLAGKPSTAAFPWTLFVGLLSACLLASANYVINGWLDGEFDKFHPTKKDRPAAAGRVTPELVYTEYALLIAIGLSLAYWVSIPFLVTSAIFVVMGIIYNVRPLRFKDHAFLDVLTESVNNPLRLMMGWSMVSADTIPPLSLFISYWFGGAFLMATKRLAEYRYISSQNKLDDLRKYRRSFQHYTEGSLTVSSFLYGLISSFFIAAFLIKYRNEFLFVFPFVAALFSYYLRMALDVGSVVQTPEKLHTDKGLMLIVGIIIGMFVLFAAVDVPLAEHIIGINKGINYLPW